MASEQDSEEKQYSTSDNEGESMKKRPSQYQMFELSGRRAARRVREEPRTSRWSSRWRVGVAGAVACGLLLAACSSSTAKPTSKSSAASKVAVTIGYENNGADPSMVTVHNHYFQKELGSNVSLKLFTSGPTALSAIASGALQFMCGIGLPPVISAIARGVPLVVVWNQERYTTDAGIVVKQSSGITSLAGLAGKTIAIDTGSESSFELPSLLAQKGISLAAVHQLTMTPPEMESAWQTGQIQAATVWDPAFDYLIAHGGRVLATDASLPANATSFNVCVANTSFTSAHPSAAVDFVKAMQDGVRYMASNPSQAMKDMESEAGISASTAQSELKGYDIYDLADQVTETVLGKGSGVATAGTTQSLTNNWKELYKQGFITVPPPRDMAKYVDPVPAASALG
ncbi:MAG: ABC transporter substrate-binding protein [Actinomycetota bacterium]|nr:ABC transporter substrate-binding protein [Actinomycetota bacterium]